MADSIFYCPNCTQNTVPVDGEACGDCSADELRGGHPYPPSATVTCTGCNLRPEDEDGLCDPCADADRQRYYASKPKA